MSAKSNMTAAARYIESLSDYREDVCCVDTGRNASSPVLIYGRSGWTSCPFQNADYTPVRLANWLHSEGGAPGHIAEIGEDGSATIYGVDTDQADETYDSEVEEIESLPAYCWLDQDMVALVQGQDACIHGGDIAVTVESWLDAGFDAEDAEPWMDARVFDADCAHELADAGITPEQVDIESDCDNGGYTVGYRYANGDISLDQVREAIGQEVE